MTTITETVPNRDRTTFAFEPERNCWRVAEAERLAVIVDAADYFKAMRAALIKARSAVYMVGWDFDLRIDLCPDEEGDPDDDAADGYPRKLGDFLIALTERAPDLDLYMLKWDGAMLAALGKQVLPTIWMQYFSDRRIHFQLDSHHPVGACHHSKIVVIDDALAFCGGIDATEDRWDTRDHAPDDRRRTQPDGEGYGPWHDVTTMLTGEAARALGDLARMRWQAAADEELAPPAAGIEAPWPDGVEANFEQVDVAIARTAPPYHGEPLVNEIEELYLDAIGTADRYLYLESQYLAAGTLVKALESRLQEPDGPEVVVVNPQNGESFMETEAMHSVRALAIDTLRDAAAGPNRFRVFHPENADGEPIYVHAKVLIADDRVLRVGSSNVDNRSMGFDTECDVAIHAKSKGEREAIDWLRDDLLAEHMDRERDEVREAIEALGLIGAIERLNRDEGRGLRTIEPEPLDPLEVALVKTRLFDPRYRPKPVQRVKHALKRGVEPHHVGAATTAALVLAVGAGIGLAWAGTKALQRLRRRRKGFPTPAVIVRREDRSGR